MITEERNRYFMDTPIIAQYYKEHEPMKRKALLEKAIQSGEDAEANAVRKELWEIRYQGASELGPQTRADGFLALWMAMEFNREASGMLFRWKSARKEINKNLTKMKFDEIRKKSPLHKELLYRECCHLVRTYMELCERDKSYNTVLCGLVTISSERAENKIKRDIRQTAIELPPAIKMEEELSLITEAAKEVYEEFFPGEGGLQ